MSDAFLGEIRLFSFDFPPQGWAFCDGAFLPINQNQPLYSLLGPTFGGNGQVNFALPDLRGRTPIHMGAGFSRGTAGGEEAHTLSVAELPTHVHLVSAQNVTATTPDPTNGLLSASSSAVGAVYGAATQLAAMGAAAVTVVGGSQPHTNMQPYLSLNFCIALQGMFPTQN